MKQPLPAEYHARMEQESLRTGRPLPKLGSSDNALPQEYHARRESLRYYGTGGKSGKSHRK